MSANKALDKQLPRQTVTIETLRGSESGGFVVPHQALVASGPAINSHKPQAPSKAVSSGVVQECSPDPLADKPSRTQ